MSKLTREWEEKIEARFENAGICNGGLFDCDCACAAPPNYQPVADASKEAAEVMAQLGREQLAESRRQYDLNRAITDQVVAQQIGLMRETERQGKDYYDYMVANQRPVEAALRDEAMAAGSQALQDAASARAVADSQGGYTRALNQALRQSRRYGLNPAAYPSSLMLQQAQNTAAMANAAREREKNIGYAKRMDVAGLYRGLPGASQGAYNLSLNSGNSAVQNQMAPGQALLAGNAQGAGLIGQGQQLQLQGLSNVLNAQTSYANAMNQMYANMGGDGGFGALLGLGASILTAPSSSVIGSWLPKSDRRLKEDIVLVGKDETTGLNIYEFSYRDDPDHRRFRGVMADEVEEVRPDAVVYDDLGFAAVDYGALGIELMEVPRYA